MFLQTILSSRIDCHKIIWFKVMRLQVLLFFSLFLMGPTSATSVAEMSKVEELSDSKTSNLK